MPEVVRLRAEGFHLSLEAGAADRIARDVIPALDALDRRPDVRVVKRNNVRTVLRVPTESAVLYVKRYHVRGLREVVKYLFVPSRAVAEWRAARAMARAGLPTVRAVFMGEKRRLGLLADGTFATEEIPGGEDYVPYLHRWFPEGREEALRRDHLARLARLVRRFHDLGFAHGDLHSGNILVTGEPSESRLHLLDLHSVRVGRRVGRRTREANLAKLLHSLTSATNGPDRIRFLREYEGESPTLGEFRPAHRRLLDGVAALERRRVRSRTKRCLRRSSSFDLARMGPWRLFFRREVFPGAPLLAVGDHLLSRIRGGREVLKDSRRSALSRQLLVAGEGSVRVVVKETKCPDAGEIVKNAFRPPRGLASWIHGTGLRVRKVGVARPVALALRGSWPFVRESYLIMEDLSDWDRLDLHVLRLYAGNLGPAARAEKLALVRACARFVGRLHRRGIYHGDLKAVNVFVRIAPDGEPEFRLVDYDRVRFGRRVSRRRRVKNLAQLAASVAVLVTKTDRLRFFRAYAPDEPTRRAEREFNRGVLRECERKIVVRMEPIE